MQRLERIDEQGGTDYIPSLAAYLEFGGNVAKAAQSLNLHKNSMYYRIERIGQLTGADLSSEQERLVAKLALAARQQASLKRL